MLWRERGMLWRERGMSWRREQELPSP